MLIINDPQAALNPALDSTYDSLTLLRDVAKTCVRCELSRTRTQVVFGDGPYLPPGEIGIMVMGEAPGEDEDAQGKPFVGRSGRLLGSMLSAAGLSRENVWVTNTNKCRPVQIEGAIYKNRAPTPPEQKACEIWWQNELKLLQPQIILCLGATAAKKLLDNKNFMITKDRGRWFAGPNNTEVLVTFHPSYVLRQRDPELAMVRQTVIDDLKTVKERLEALRAGTAPLQSWQRTAPKKEDDSGQLSMF